MAVIVEFVGLPASGKSTLAAYLAEVLEEMGVKTGRHPHLRVGARLVSKVATAFRFRRALAIGVAAMASDERPLGKRLRSIRWLLSTLERYRAGRGRMNTDGVVVIAEGVLQRSLLLFFNPHGNARPQWLVERYVEAVPRPDVIIRLRAELQTVALRHAMRIATSRQLSRDDRFASSTASLEEVMKGADMFLTGITSHLAVVQGVTVLEVTSDGEQAFHVLKHQVAPLIREWTRP